MSTRYVPIERTFLPFQASKEMDLEVEVYFSWHELTSGISWSELLKSRLVVVLGEAGSGKTQEFRHQAERLNAAGHTAFFLRVEALLDGPLTEAFEHHADARRFEDWCSQDPEACFFLDSRALDKSRRWQVG
jgi:hypothetical protein